MMCELGETFSGDVVDTAILPIGNVLRTIQYCEIDGRARVEGCIDLGSIRDVQEATATARTMGPLLAEVFRSTAPIPRGMAEVFGSGIRGENFRWDDATIPFEIDSSLPAEQQAAILRAIEHWQERTRIRFKKRTATDEDVVRFHPGKGCSSAIGRRGGMQGITLAAICGFGNIVHEIGHAVGLWHEQSRTDRDLFVKVLWQNVDPVKRYNFDQRLNDSTNLGDYDYDSIMHYGPAEFSRNGKPTLEPVSPANIGQRIGLSALDIAAVGQLYP